MINEESLRSWRSGSGEALYISRGDPNAVDIPELVLLSGINKLVYSSTIANVAFLSELGSLEGLRLHVPTADLSPIEALHDLRELMIIGRSSKHVDFELLYSLTEIDIDPWSRNFESLFRSQSIRRVKIQGYREKSLKAFASLPNLLGLTLWGGSPIIDLSGLELCQHLELLDLRNLTHLRSLKGVEGLPLLRLYIDSVGSHFDIGALSELQSLVSLSLINCHQIPTISFISNLPNLEQFHFFDNTDIADGDIGPILTHDKLRDVRFVNRRHYSHTCEQVWATGKSPKTNQEIAGPSREEIRRMIEHL